MHRWLNEMIAPVEICAHQSNKTRYTQTSKHWAPLSLSLSILKENSREIINICNNHKLKVITHVRNVVILTSCRNIFQCQVQMNSLTRSLSDCIFFQILYFIYFLYATNLVFSFLFNKMPFNSMIIKWSISISKSVSIYV